MRIAVILVAVAGCNSILGVHTFVPEPDAPDGNDPDAAIDARTSCNISSIGAGVDRATVGSDLGGFFQADLVCSGPDRMIGLGLSLTGSFESAGIRVVCAHTTVDASGPHVGSTTLVGVSGTNPSPPIVTPLAMCPTGAVLSGLSAHDAVSGLGFENATISCTPIDEAGQPGTVMVIAVNNSGSDTTTPTGGSCSAGEQIVAMWPRTGTLLDSLHLFCAPTSCN